jgi:hypothetical protein
MHSILCGSAALPYQALERIPAQETSLRYEGLNTVRAGPRYVGATGRLIIWRPLQTDIL